MIRMFVCIYTLDDKSSDELSIFDEVLSHVQVYNDLCESKSLSLRV